MSSSAPPPASSNRTSSDVTALVAELARVIKGRRFYGPQSAQLARLFERALRAWQAELGRHGDLEIAVAADGLRVPGLPTAAFAGEFSTLRGMLAQRGVRSLRVESGLDADGFAALLEVLVSDAAKLAREGGVESALYARAPVGFVVNGNAPHDPTAPAAAPAPVEPEPELPVGESPASAAEEVPDEPLPEAQPGSPTSEEAAEPTPAPPELAGPTEIADEPGVQEAGLGEPAETGPERGLDTAPDIDPGLDTEPDHPSAAEVPTDPDRTFDLPTEPPPAVAHDALPPIPSSLLDPGPVGPAVDSLPSFPSQPPLAPASGFETGADEEITSPAFDTPTGEPDREVPGTASPSPAGDPAPEGNEFEFGETPAPDVTDGLASAQFADGPAFDETPTLGIESELQPTGTPEPEGPPLDFGGEPLEFDLGPGEDGALETGDGEVDMGFGAPGFDAPDVPGPGPAGSEQGGSREPAPPPPRPVADASTETLVAELLRDLDDCTEGMVYRELAERAANAAEKLADEGLENDAYVVLRALAVHASDEDKRSAEQREAAREHLRRLATGALLEPLLSRACGETEGSLEANQILVQLGSDVVVPVFRVAATERNAERRERLNGILIAMGEEALPDLLRLMRSEELVQARSAVRLAGEIQSPAAVGRLTELLESSSKALSQEVSKALVRINDSTAIRSLADALKSPVDHVPGLAAYALGASNSALAVEALLGALHRAIVEGDTEFAREVIRSLGRLGRAEATPDLAAILLRRGLRQRRRHRELKLAAAAALGRLPGDEAVGALAQAAQSRDAHIRRAAQIALDRRAQALAGPSS